MNYFNKYVKKYWKPFCTALCFLMLEAFCDLMQPTIMSKIVDIGVAGKNLHYVLRMGGVMLFITALGATGAVTRNIISSRVSQNFGSELRGDLFKKIQSFSFDNIDNFQTASLVTRVTNDVTQVQNFVNGLMRIFVKAPLLCIGSIIMVIRLNFSMSIIILIVVPIIGVFIILNMKIGYPYFVKVQSAMDKVNGVMREYLSGVRVVKAFNRFKYERNRFGSANSELSELSTSAMRVMAVFSPGVTLTVNLGIVFVIWIGGIGVNKGDMHVGQIIAFVNYMTQILFSLIMISYVLNMFVRARASAERIGEVFSEKNTILDKGFDIEISNLKGRIEFENVSFSYKGSSGEPVLKDISFTCNAGETIGIIGATGSGKSTLVNLIPRFYEATKGKIKIDGVDVTLIDQKLLREKIAVVPQKNVLFTGTIFENITWGKEDASENEVIEAAVVAEAHDFIKTFKEGYHTMLGQGGVNLSGGQKQRVAIARALIRKPEILILDDSTSAVDVATEGKIREGIKGFSKKITCLIIAQRISSVMEADRIIVLEDGRIADFGTHSELIKNCNIYKDIFKSQVGEDTYDA